MKINHPLKQPNNYDYKLIYAINHHKKSIRLKTKLKWLVRLLLPDFLVDEPSLIDNLKILIKSSEFKSLRLAFISWVIFTFVVIIGFIYYIKNFSQINATVNSWTFDDPANYNFDNTALNVSSGKVTLFKIDQIDDDNSSSGFAGGIFNDTAWNSTQNWLELDSNGLTNQTGDFISRVIDAKSDVDWNNISWTPVAPYAKELSDNQQSEYAYSSDNLNMANNTLLLHLNESVGATSFQDTSSSGYHGSCSGSSCPTSGVAGKFKTAVSFDGNDNIKFGNVLNPGSDDLSICMWFKVPNSSGSDKILYNKENLFEARVAGGYLNYAWQPHWAWDGGTSFPVANNTWYHACVVYDHTTQYLYRNGTLVFSRPQTGDMGTNTSQFCLGGRNGSSCISAPFSGIIDEFSVFNRALSSTEIQSMYQRGALNLKLQVRSCDDVLCDSEQFVGPDGTVSSYYSELDNTSLGLPTNISLTNVQTNRYFQYKVILQTDDGVLNPALKSVEFKPDHYDISNPIISNQNAITFSEVQGFSEILGSTNQGIVKYQISNDGINWYYFNGTNWIIGTNDVAYANDSTVINSNISQFTSDVADGDFYFKAFLVSNNAEEQVELDNISIDYTEPSSNQGGQGGNNNSSNSNNPSSNSSNSSGSSSANTSDNISQNDEKYKIIWNIYDSETKQPLDGLSVVDTSNWQESQLVSPIEHIYLQGSYTTVWQKEGYKPKTIIDWEINKDDIKNVYLEKIKDSKVQINDNLESNNNQPTDFNSYFISLLVGIMFSIISGFVLLILSIKAIWNRNLKIMLKYVKLKQEFFPDLSID